MKVSGNAVSGDRSDDRRSFSLGDDLGQIPRETGYNLRTVMEIPLRHRIPDSKRRSDNSGKPGGCKDSINREPWTILSIWSGYSGRSKTWDFRGDPAGEGVPSSFCSGTLFFLVFQPRRRAGMGFLANFFCSGLSGNKGDFYNYLRLAERMHLP